VAAEVGGWQTVVHEIMFGSMAETISPLRFSRGVVDLGARIAMRKLSGLWGRAEAKVRGRRVARRRSPGCEVLEDRRLLAVNLQFDYSLDSSGFFTADRRTLLQNTLNAIASRLNDTLAAVSSYTYSITTSSGDRSVTTSVAANTIKLYVFGDSLSGMTAGIGGGNWFVTDNNSMRGQGPNDYAPNIGHIRFDNDGSTNWYFGSTTSGLTSAQTDFVSIARHEFLHVLGFSQGQPTFDRFIQNGTFVGPNAKAAFNNIPVPMNGSHVANSIDSVMNSSTLNGTRKDLRDLEWGMLKDLGWSVSAPATPPGFYLNWTLFTDGDGDGKTIVRVNPSRGVYMMRVDVLAGDQLRLLTRDGAAAGEKGVDTYLKIFNSAGQEIDSSDDSSSGGKEDFTHTFSVGGTYWVGASTYDQKGYTYTTPSTFVAPSTAFYLEATLTGRPDSEPDNINGATTPIAFTGGSYFRQTTLAGPDSDYYRVDMAANHTYTVKTALPAAGGLSAPAVITIYDATGRKVAGMDGSSRYGQVSFKAPVSGRYYVVVQGSAGAAQVRPDEGGITIGGSSYVGSEYSSSYDRGGGCDYTLTITDTEPSLGAHPVFLDFGSEGLWVWSESSGYQIITTANPENIVAQGNMVYMDFGSEGLWTWTPNAAGGATNGKFAKINPANPQGMAAGPNDMLFIDFGPAGLWYYQRGAYALMSAADPEGIAAAPDGSLYVDFGSFGLWRWTSGGGFRQLSAANPEGIAVAQNGSKYDGWAYIDFGPAGLWRWNAAVGFQKLNAANPESLSVGPDNVLYIDFGPSGLWRWSTSIGFQKLNPANPTSLAAGSDGFLYIDFGSAGLWRWSPTVGYQQLHLKHVETIAIS
jgi:hypothetical protein